MTDSDQTKTKVTLKESSTTSESAKIPQKQLQNVSVELGDNSSTPPKIIFNNYPPNYIPELRAAISALSRKKEVLLDEHNRLKMNTIRPAEIAFIKAQTQFYSSQNHTFEFEDLMNKYIETMRASSALKALCNNLERKIENEELRRSDFIAESNILEHTYNFQDVVLKPMNFYQLDEEGRMEQLEIQRLTQRLTTIHNNLKELNKEPDYQTNMIALEEIIRSNQAKSNLNMIGLQEINKEIQKMSVILNQNEDLVDIMISENSNKRRKIESKSHINYKNEETKAQEFQQKVKEFQDELEKDSDEIETIRSKLNKLISENYSIDNDISRIKSMPKPVVYNTDSDDDDYNESEKDSSSQNDDNDDFYILQSNQQLEFTLNQQAFQLRSQVNELNQQYHNLKIAAVDKQNRIIRNIQKLEIELQNNKRKIKRMNQNKSNKKVTIADFDEVGSINELFSKINESIDEISSSYFGEKF